MEMYIQHFSMFFLHFQICWKFISYEWNICAWEPKPHVRNPWNILTYISTNCWTYHSFIVTDLLVNRRSDTRSWSRNHRIYEVPRSATWWRHSGWTRSRGRVRPAASADDEESLSVVTRLGIFLDSVQHDRMAIRIKSVAQMNRHCMLCYISIVREGKPWERPGKWNSRTFVCSYGELHCCGGVGDGG
jgi:hypothetical protein